MIFLGLGGFYEDFMWTSGHSCEMTRDSSLRKNVHIGFQSHIIVMHSMHSDIYD